MESLPSEDTQYYSVYLWDCTLGAYFISCLTSDIEALNYFGGIHQVVNGHHRALSKRFPFSIYYDIKSETLTVVAVLDARQDPLWIRQRLG